MRYTHLRLTMELVTLNRFVAVEAERHFIDITYSIKKIMNDTTIIIKYILFLKKKILVLLFSPFPNY